MPYIKQVRRDKINPAYDYREEWATNPGELNYCFTALISEYLETQGKSYQTINDIIGALEGAKLEFYRRVAAPYEDTKIQENGDVY